LSTVLIILRLITESDHMSATKSFTSIAPGRICLFGEHQDYLGLPVIALSLPLECRIQVVAPPTTCCGENRVLTLHIPALNETRRYDLANLPPRQGPETLEPDFALAAIHEALDDDWTLGNGADCISTTDIPIKAGCSSSSAFCVAWSNVLAQLAEKHLSPIELAARAYRAEVLHFGAPGGTMDHITSAVGGKLRIGPGMWDTQTLPDLGVEDLGVWVLADSGEPKDTLGHLWRCKNERSALLDKLGGDWDKRAPEHFLTSSEWDLLKCTRINKMTEEKAFEEWMKGGGLGTGARLGALMAAHHEALRDGLNLSTPRLEAMNTSAMSTGAWGFKVVGSGGGGCGVAWTSEANAESVAAAMESAGGAQKTWIIRQPSKSAYISMAETL
jgi:galactokinase